MSLKPKQIDPVPRQTKRVAKAAFPKGNLYLTLRDQLGPIFQDQDFSDLFPKDGQPALPPWRLALVTILQFRENLPDRQAAEAVRGRIDWKYLPELRDRSNLANSSRKLELVAPEEIAIAVQMVVHGAYGIQQRDIPRLAVRLLGFMRVTEDMRSRVDSVVDQMIGDRRLVVQGSLLMVPGGA